MRIVTLLPSATEMVCGLGLRDQLVGVSHECDFPVEVVDLPKVTCSLIPSAASSAAIDSMVRQRVKEKQPLYSLDVDRLLSLQPDLIVTQSLCEVCAVSERDVDAAICSLPSQVSLVNLNPTTLDDVLQGILDIGAAASSGKRAKDYVDHLRQRINAVAERASKVSERPRVMLLEWIDPPFSAGHWNPELVHLAGGREVMGVAGQKSVAVDWERVRDADPEILVIACCGFTADRSRQDLSILQSKPGWQSLSCVRSNRVHIVDGSAYFNRPGPRLVDSLEMLGELLARDKDL